MAQPADFERLGDLLKDACSPPVHGDEAQTPPGTAEVEGVVMPGGSRWGAAQERGVAKLLAVVWTEAVGEEVAANARPVHFRQGRLTVSASSSAWAQTLQLMAEIIRSRLNERLGEDSVGEVVFRHAGWEERGDRSRACAAEGGAGTKQTGAVSAPTPAEQAAIAEVKELALDPELEEAILRAMRTSFGRI